MADLETLQIRIKADADKAYKAIDTLANSINNLSVSIGKIETGKLNDLSTGLTYLNAAILNIKNTTNKDTFKSIVTNLNVLQNVNVSQLNSLGVSLLALSDSLKQMSTTVPAAADIRKLVTAIGRLSGDKVTNAIANIPQLEVALSNLITRFSTLPQINQSIIEFTNSLANLAQQGGKTGTAVEKIDHALGSFGETTVRTTRKGQSLERIIGKLYARFWLFLRGARALKNSFISAADYLEAFNYFDVTAKKIGKDTFAKAGVGSAEEYAQAFMDTMQEKLHKMSGLELDLEDRLIKTTNAKSLGLNLTELTQYQASIASISNAMGNSQEIAQSTAKAFSMLAGDMGSLKNLDFEQVSQNLQSALTGQARALYRYGIDLTEASLEQYAFTNGITKSVSEMSQAEKAQLRLLAILDQSKVAWGDLANTINSPSNQLRMLQNNLKETGTVFGQLFIPIMQSALPVINGLSLAIKQLLVDIANLLGIKLDLDSFGQFGEDIDADVESMEELNKTMAETKKGIRDFDELKVINDSKKKGTGVGDQIDLTKQIIDATNEYEKVWNEAYERMTSKASEIAGYISGAFEPIKRIIEDFHIGDFFKAGQDVSSLVTSIFNFVSDAIDQVDWEGLGIKIGDFIKGLNWTDIFKGFGGIVASAIQAAFDIWTGSFEVAPLETAIITALAILKFSGIGSALTKSLGGAISGWLKKEGISKEFLAKAGIGALLVGLSVSFTIDTITKVATGQTAIKSFEFWSEAAINSLLAGAGFTLLGSALGLATGGSALLLTFGISAGLSMVFQIIAADLSKPEPNVERDLAEQQYAWVKDKHLDNIDVITNITMKAGEINDQMGNIDFLASKVEDLSDRYNELTDAERAQLKYYSDELVKVMPEVAGQIDSVTGAYKGTREELEKLIETQKAQIRSAATMQIISDIEKQKLELQPDYDRLKNEFSNNRKIFDAYSNTLRNLGVSDKELMDLIDGKSVKGVSTDIAKEYKQAYENLAASNDAFSIIEADWNELESKYSYYMGIYEEDVKTTMENATKTLEDADKENKKIIDSSPLPRSISNVLGRVDTVINQDGAVSEYDMNNLFEAINTSFAGLGNGEVPTEVQNMMDAVKLAILSNSPDLVNYMANLKQLMIDSFLNAKVYVTSGGDFLYNRNGIAERLYKDVGKIEEGTYKKTNVGNNVKNLKSDLLELFGGEELPEEVNKAYMKLSDTISKGQGQKAVFDALNEFKTKVGKVAYQSGITFDFSLGTGVWDGSNYFFTSLEDMYKGGFEVTQDVNEMHSPSRKYEALAENIPAGAALGIRKGIPKLELAVEAMSNAIQSTFGNIKYYVPDINLGYSNTSKGFNYGSMDSNNGFMSQMINMANSAANGATEVIFKVEGDPYGIFKVVRAENDKYKNRTQRSAF